MVSPAFLGVGKLRAREGASPRVKGMNKQPKSELIELIRLGKGQGFPNEASQALAQGTEPALDMVGFSAVFPHRLTPVSSENRW